MPDVVVSAQVDAFMATGVLTVPGQTQLAASQALTDANSAVSRGLGDARYATLAQGGNADDPLGTGDIINWQPNSFSRLVNGSGAPLNVGFVGDSLTVIGPLVPGRNMARAGLIGSGYGNTSGTVTGYVLGGPNGPKLDYWINGTATVFAVGAAGEFSCGNPAPAYIRGNKAVIYYLKGPGLGTVTFQYQADNGGAWTTFSVPTNGIDGSAVNCSNATLIGAVFEANLPTSNSPSYKIRVSNVITGEFRFIGAGVYNTSGGGVISNYMLASGGLDLSAMVCPSAIYTPIYTHLAPDINLSCWADHRFAWGVTNPTPDVSQGSAPSSPTIDMIWLNTTSGITYYYEGAVTGWVQCGLFRTFYASLKAIKATTDWVQISRPPSYEESVSGWVTATSYALNALVYVPSIVPVVLYKCTSAHTSGASTQPGVGASWATVWSVYTPSPAIVSSSLAIAKNQAVYQKDWATTEDQSFISGWQLFRDWESGNNAGLYSDIVHLSAAGGRQRSANIWSKLPLGHVSLGALDADWTAASFPIQKYGSGDLWEITPGIRAYGTSANIKVAAQDAPNDRQKDFGLTNTGGTTYLATNGGTALILGSSSYTGAQAPFDNAMLGGLSGYNWRAAFTGIRVGYVEKTANYSLVQADHTVNVTANSPTITLPLAQTGDPTGSGITGKLFAIFNSGAGTITVATTSSQTVNGTTPATIAAGTSRRYQSTGAGWIAW